MTASTYLTMIAQWLACGLALVLVRQLLMLVALRSLKPTILYRLEWPEGHRIREPMRFGIVYTVAERIGWIGFSLLAAAILHPVLLGFDRGWDLQLGIVVIALIAIAGAAFAVDRLLAFGIRRSVGVPDDWRARAL